MSKKSLILKFYEGDNNVAIFDVHEARQLKNLGTTSQEIFDIIDKHVRDGKITFDYLLSNAVSCIKDIEIEESADDLQGFEVGQRVMYAGQEFIITLFNFSAKPITAKIESKFTTVTVALDCITPMSTNIRPNSHFSMTMAPSTQEVITTGGSSSVYMTHIKNPTTLDNAYDAECNDIIESLEMTPAEANIFKAVWRTAKARQGKVKKANHNAVYDAEKCMFFSERMLIAANEAEISNEH